MSAVAESSEVRQPLTDRQRQVYEAIVRHFSEHGGAPTVRELMPVVGTDSPNGVVCHLKALAKKGWIRKNYFEARNIRLAESAPSASVLGEEVALSVCGQAFALSREEAVRLGKELLDAGLGVLEPVALCEED